MAPPKGSYRDLDDGLVVGRVERIKVENGRADAAFGL